jgi:hypothetical protein
MYVEATELLGGRSTQDPVAMGIQLIPRILSAFQGSVILIERGMSIEAKTLARVIYEAAIWIGYLHEKPSEAAPQLHHETLRSEIGLFKASLATNPDMEAAVKAEVNARIREMTASRNALPKAPDIQEVARLGGFGPTYLHYRLLSNGAAHASLKSTIGYLQRDDAGDFTGHVVGHGF